MVPRLLVAALAVTLVVGLPSFSAQEQPGWQAYVTNFDGDGKDAHGVAVTPDGSELWITTQTTDTVTVVGTRDHDVRAHLPVGRDPNWIEMTGDGALAVVSNTGGNSVTIVDVRSRRVLQTLAVGPGPKRLTIAAVRRQKTQEHGG